MYDDDQLSAGDRELESMLGSLRPATPAIQRDAVMFQAGQRVALRRCRFWQWTSGTLAASLAAALLMRPQPLPTRTIVVQNEPSSTPALTSEASESFVIRNRVADFKAGDDILTRRVEDLPQTRNGKSSWFEPLPQVERLGWAVQANTTVTTLDTLKALLNPGVGT